MIWRIVRQPNNLFARFCEVVDDFTHIDMTEDEARDLCVELDVVNVEQKMKRAILDRNESGVPGDGLGRWREACEEIEAVHGLDRLRQRIRETTTPTAQGLTR